MPISEIMTAWQSLKVAGDLAKGLIDLKTMAEIQTNTAELNQKILAAQGDLFAANATHAALIEEVGELKERLLRMENWDAQKKRYRLVAVSAGTAAYALKKSMSDGEPPHYLCTNCYENGKRSILNAGHSMRALGGYTVVLICTVPTCKVIIDTGALSISVAKYAEDFAGK